MNAEHEHVTVNLPPYYTHSTADTWHPTLVPKNSGYGKFLICCRWEFKPESGERQLAVSDNVLDHIASMCT